MIFTQAARDAAEACAGFMRDKNHQVPTGKSPMDYAHAVDGVRYAAVFLVSTQPAFKDIRRATIARRLRQQEDEETGVEELQDGYMKVVPSAF